MTAPDLVPLVCGYRAGYTAEERREIERDLFSGRFRGVAATNALELGIDVGSLDVTVHLGFPGTVASLWQQAGRAGRREQKALSVYVAFDSPLDQYFMQDPKHLFDRPLEAAAVDARNAKTVSQHVCCAAHEIPVRWPCPDEESFFGAGLGAALDDLRSRGLVGAADPTLVFNSLPPGAPAAGAFAPPNGSNSSRGPGPLRAWRYCGPPFRGAGPAGGISLRAIEDERYQARRLSTMSERHH